MKVSIGTKIQKGPWGGGNLFAINLRDYLIKEGHEVVTNLNIIYTTVGRLIAMIAASVFVLITQNPHQYLVVLFMSIFREGQETIIDPLFPYANAAPPMADFVIHLVIVALEIWAFIIVYRMTKKES